jgi:hypothetical protein
MPKRNYPGRLTHEQWLALPRAKRHDLAARMCSGDPAACHQKLWLLQKKKPKTLRRRYDKFAALLRD